MAIGYLSLWVSFSRKLKHKGSPVRFPSGGDFPGTRAPGVGCVSGARFHGAVIATLVYALCLDCIVTVLAIYKLARTGVARRSHVVDLMFKDGLLYFIIV